MEGELFDKPFEPGGNTDINAAYDGIFTMFSTLVPDLPAALYDRFRKVTFPISFAKDQVILDYGEICKHAYFAISGLVRLTRILTGRGETTVMFLTEGDILVSPKSFYKQTMSVEKLTALMDTFCIALPWEELQILYRDFIEANVVVRLLTEQYYLQALERATWFYESPQVRYGHVLTAYPKLVQHVSVKELASYLGIAPETLSRIRNRISRKRRKP
ncbi:Crp/Fnr family transcriptional regulator [Pedobacter sp. ISL-68]|uniref:Crp/Fnr family transcriptional regulator n=1 Tax=unclassified Pedobacter TaxID=2628915 RepID=UPI001BE98232|nr:MULTISPECIES: Crp/Fnr family transcriptional regulator [unclassified Pedobacter]MBT2561307.1 Crp/Fnr family transcriptional regulator [Pedobacter sp. ISL-64]MBT2590696.1 Crp/Fnr family transcriptional regulator [Pedobacter sp. ISL-68]